jgi:pyruvate dehydrogenase E1 component alpha subunit
VIDALAADDAVAASYRCHAAYLAKGGDMRAMIAEMFGKRTGCAGGRGGSMHLIDMERLVLGASAVVASHIPVACGYALALRREGRGRMVAVFLGDGATEEGVFYESLNFAALHRLPVLFVCENNFLAIHTPLARRWATNRLAERVATFGMPAATVADGDIFRIRERAVAAVARARAGLGPSFIECHTCRWREHVGPNEDHDAGYRGHADVAPWIADDQVARLAALLDPAVAHAIAGDVEAEIADAFAFAAVSPFPRPEELDAHVLA